MEPERQYIARFWKEETPAKIFCELCPRHCRLAEGQKGFCFVRQNVGGQMVLTTYGRTSGFCIDPIEKKPLNHFYPGTAALSFGTTGCNLGCKFCQNWDISRSRDPARLSEAGAPDKIADCGRQTGCKSVAFTYNDPVIFMEYAVDVAQACHAAGIKTVAVTAGYISDEARPEFFQHMDAANVDLKGFSEKFYRDYANSSLQPVLDTLEYIKKQTRVWLEVTSLLIPGVNDSDGELTAMTGWLAGHLDVDVPLHFSAFHPDFQMRDYPATPLGTLQRARQIARAQGLRYVYTGNVHDPEGAGTYCHGCGQLLIERYWYELRQYHLRDINHCEYCNAVCAGCFDEKPGDWAGRRLPVSIAS